MPVYIVDNGLDYSDHLIYFLDSDEPQELVQQILTATDDGPDWGTRKTIIGVADAITWMDEVETVALAKFVCAYSLCKQPELTRKLPRHVIYAALAQDDNGLGWHQKLRDIAGDWCG